MAEETGGADVVPSRAVGEAKDAPQAPIASLTWRTAPVGAARDSIRQRASEFFRIPGIPMETRALGALLIEPLVDISKRSGLAAFVTALHGGLGFRGEPTLYAMNLYRDRLDLGLSPMSGYGETDLQALSLPTGELDQQTSRIAGELARVRPDIVEGLLSEDQRGELCLQAKVSLMRFVAQNRPGQVHRLHEMGGMEPHIGLVFSVNRQNEIAKMYLRDIPNSDPILGEVMDVYNALEYFRDKTLMLTKEEMDDMTVMKIQKYLENLPEPARRIIGGDYNQIGTRSWRILEKFERLGIKGNEAQMRWRKVERLGSAVYRFSGDMRDRILETIISGKSPEEAKLSPDDLDQLFAKHYKDVTKKSPPPGFSFIHTLVDKTPLDELNL